MRFSLATLLLSAGLVLVARAPAQEQEHPIVDAVKAKIGDPARPFTMFVHLKVKDGAAEKFEASFAKAIAGTRKEKGNRAYDLNRMGKDSSEYVVYERWQNLDALRFHVKTPHITNLLAEIGDLLAGPPEVKSAIPAGE
jgi:quinol monooxygenase YgiN